MVQLVFLLGLLCSVVVSADDPPPCTATTCGACAKLRSCAFCNSNDIKGCVEDKQDQADCASFLPNSNPPPTKHKGNAHNCPNDAEANWISTAVTSDECAKNSGHQWCYVGADGSKGYCVKTGACANVGLNDATAMCAAANTCGECIKGCTVCAANGGTNDLHSCVVKTAGTDADCSSIVALEGFDFKMKASCSGTEKGFIIDAVKAYKDCGANAWCRDSKSAGVCVKRAQCTDVGLESDVVCEDISRCDMCVGNGCKFCTDPGAATDQGTTLRAALSACVSPETSCDTISAGDFKLTEVPTKEECTDKMVVNYRSVLADEEACTEKAYTWCMATLSKGVCLQQDGCIIGLTRATCEDYPTCNVCMARHCKFCASDKLATCAGGTADCGALNLANATFTGIGESDQCVESLPKSNLIIATDRDGCAAAEYQWCHTGDKFVCVRGFQTCKESGLNDPPLPTDAPTLPPSTEESAAYHNTWPVAAGVLVAMGMAMVPIVAE